jgi:hypothetical protein
VTADSGGRRDREKTGAVAGRASRDETRADARGSDGRAERWARIAIGFAFVWFAARLTFFALAISPAVPPDEETHVGRVLFYSRTWLLPSPGPDDHALGLLSNRPFLYNWVLGRFAAMGLNDLASLRLLNAAAGLGTVWFGLRFIRVVSRNPLTHVVFVLLLTHTLMFTGISAAVSYDNGANLLAAASFYTCARLFANAQPRDLGLLLLMLGLGCLTKRTFLPLAALIIVAVALHERSRVLALVRALPAMGRGVTAALAVVIVANGVLYGGNLLQFGRLVPGFDQVVGPEAARANRIYARDQILDGYREGRIEFSEAMKRTTSIPHDRDRESTRRQLVESRKRGDWRASFPAYAYWWSRIMIDRSMGYFGHQVIHRFVWEQIGYVAVLLLALALHLSRWRTRNRLAEIGGLVGLGYAAVLLLLVGYPNYLEKGILDSFVQGRYLFPALIPLIGWLATSLCENPPRAIQAPIAAAVCVFFVFGDLPVFLLRSSAIWFGTGP